MLTPTQALVLALLALGVGAVLFTLGRRVKGLLAALDGFVLTSTLALVLGMVLPEAVHEVGFGAIGAAIAGLLLPAWFERRGHHLIERTHHASILSAIALVSVHALLDGAGLVHADTSLQAAIVLHRIPEGLLVWWLIRPVSKNLAIGSMIFLGAASIVGFVAGETYIVAEVPIAWWFTAFVAGSLLHVVGHAHGPQEGIGDDGDPRPLASGIGALAGIALVMGVAFLESGGGHGGHHGAGGGAPVLDAFLALTFESAPMLLIAYLGAGLVHSFFSESAVNWMTRGGTFSQAIRGMSFGLPLPVCSCGVVPIYQSLVTRGVPATAAMAFLVATPELGLDAVLISLPLLGGDMTIARVVAAAGVALAVGWGVGRLVPSALPKEGEEGDPLEDLTFTERLRLGVITGLGEVVDRTGPWILFGLLVAALCVPALDPAWIAQIPQGMDVAIFALLGIPLYVCASGATPIVAVLLFQGVSPGAALAFLLAGPATNVATYGLLRDLHGRRIALIFGGAIAGLSIVAGLALNQLLPSVQGFAPTGHVHEHGGWLGWAAVFALLALFASSLVRQGARPFLGAIMNFGTHEHPEDEGESCCDSPPEESPTSCH